MPEPQKFATLQSCVDTSFWSELGHRKLNDYKLSEDAVSIHGFLTASRHEELSAHLQVLSTSFATHQDGAAGAEGHGSSSSSSSGGSGVTGSTPTLGAAPTPGMLINVNTIEAFKRLDKPQLLRQAAAKVWADICSGAAEADPALLCPFLLLTYGDLKRFVFNYWFAFPALKPPQPFQHVAAQPLAEQLAPAAVQQVCSAADTWRGVTAASGSSSSDRSSSMQLYGLLPDPGHASSNAGPGSSSSGGSGLLVHPISAWQQLQQQEQGGSSDAGASAHQPWLVVCDPSHLPLTPGWPLRNLLLLAAKRWGVQQVTVLCVRDAPSGRMDPQRSFVVRVQLPELPAGWKEGPGEAPDAVGWEANAQGRLLARVMDVSHLMSPLQLATQAVDLNLRLMRWRAAPDLDLSLLTTCRCLLLGAGTLGCAVSRTLMAWGVRSITFVDSSTVSYSNPVRQSLFVQADCLEGGRPKAEAAAEALRAIYPAVEAAGVRLNVPMPGHPPSSPQQEAEQQQAFQQLEELVTAADAVFLLTDTRESRWLPSLLAAAHGKVVITAALGFDGYVVMRHGLPAPGSSSGAGAAAAAGSGAEAGGAAAEGSKQRQLGCYFCNDVVAPLNSTVDRTLDQQCTVARPGLAAIAGALATELLAGLLQHPLKGHAPADAAGGALGPIPHMIRGQLSGFSQVVMQGVAFSQCTACSPAVLEAYRSDSWVFVAKVLRDPKWLEELTGLAELHRQMLQMEVEMAAAEEEEAGAAAAGAGASGSDDEWAQL